VVVKISFPAAGSPAGCWPVPVPVPVGVVVPVGG
jgi:hypothetical protein